MTKEELAALLNGRQYRQEITNAEASQAQKSGLVVVYGHSDDLMEFQGAIYDEVGAWEGTEVLILDGEIVGENNTNTCGDECKWFKQALKNAVKVEALWCKEPPYSWTYQTTIPHATFDIMDDGEKYCRGIVFDLKDAKI